MTPREELMVAAWEARRMLAALVVGKADGGEDALIAVGRPLAAGIALAAVVVAVMLLA